jgi:multidrug efflux system membrane fusion protein
MVVINQISPVFVTFGVPERYLGRISGQNAQHKLVVEASVGKDFKDAVRGTLTVIDNTVDPVTGTIRLKAVFDNKDGRLWPGQFVNYSLTLQTEKAIVIPSEAIQVGQNGSFVYVVKADQSVEPRPVVVGQIAGGNVIVEKGLAIGESVVTDGQSRLFPGAKIVAASNPSAANTPAN